MKSLMKNVSQWTSKYWREVIIFIFAADQTKKNITPEKVTKYWERSACLKFSDSLLVQKNIASVKKKEHIMNLHSFAKFLIGAINLR